MAGASWTLNPSIKGKVLSQVRCVRLRGEELEVVSVYGGERWEPVRDSIRTVGTQTNERLVPSPRASAQRLHAWSFMGLIFLIVRCLTRDSCSIDIVN